MGLRRVNIQGCLRSAVWHSSKGACPCSSFSTLSTSFSTKVLWVDCGNGGLVIPLYTRNSQSASLWWQISPSPFPKSRSLLRPRSSVSRHFCFTLKASCGCSKFCRYTLRAKCSLTLSSKSGNAWSASCLSVSSPRQNLPTLFTACLKLGLVTAFATLGLESLGKGLFRLLKVHPCFL